jgi:hypothetical protein
MAKAAAAPRTSAPKKPAWWSAYFATLAETGNRTAAAQLCNIDRTTPQKYVKAHPEEAAEYALLESEAMDQAADALEKEARRRAVEGVSKPVYQGGKKVGTIQEYSDVLLIFLLKGARPAKYRERYDVNVTPLPVDRLTPEQLERLATGEAMETVLREGKASEPADRVVN